MPSTKLVFFTYSNKEYYLFVLPYIYFALSSNPDAKVEIILEDLNDFLATYNDATKHLESLFPGQFILRQSTSVKNKINCTPNVIRFIEEPQTKAEYVYIGDIDIIVMEDIYDVHSKLIIKNNLPFSNIIRKGTETTDTPRLTGLHFCKTATMYPLPNIDDINLKARNDENVLYEIMSRQGAMIPLSFKERPICGIHISLNRDCVGRYSIKTGHEYFTGLSPYWAGITTYDEKLLEMFKEEKFGEVYLRFDLEYRALLMVVESISKGKLRALNRVSAEFLVDKRLSSSLSSGKLNTLLAESERLIASDDTSKALVLLHDMVNIWPNNFTIYLKLAQTYFHTNKVSMGENCLQHAKDVATQDAHYRAINNTSSSEKIKKP